MCQPSLVVLLLFTASISFAFPTTPTTPYPGDTLHTDNPDSTRTSGPADSVRMTSATWVSVDPARQPTNIIPTGAATQLRTADCTHPDYAALADLYNATNGPNWTNKTGWLTDCNLCGWYGIGCTNGRVTTLNLVNNGLQGSIPMSLSGLTNLSALSLALNQLSGTIPANLGNLTNLNLLELSSLRFQNEMQQARWLSTFVLFIENQREIAFPLAP